jgi:hypothetical protein
VNGRIVDGPVVGAAEIDDFVDFVATPEGDVVWADRANGTTLRVTRVAGCGG